MPYSGVNCMFLRAGFDCMCLALQLENQEMGECERGRGVDLGASGASMDAPGVGL